MKAYICDVKLVKLLKLLIYQRKSDVLANTRPFTLISLFDLFSLDESLKKKYLQLHA